MLYPNPDVHEILEALFVNIRNSLGDNLEGLYVKGSLALGDFNPETSDVDLLVVVKQALDQADFERLSSMHRKIQSLPNRYNNEIELAYVPVSKLNRFVPRERYISLERGDQLKWKTLASNWILDFWIVREHGITLFGPDPKTLIDPILPKQMVEAVRGLMPDWLEWVDTWDDPGFQTHMGEMRYAVETMCRVFYMLEFSSMSSKPVAVRWALGNLGEPWYSLILESQSWYGGQPTNPITVRRIAEFVRWVVAEGA